MCSTWRSGSAVGAQWQQRALGRPPGLGFRGLAGGLFAAGSIYLEFIVEDRWDRCDRGSSNPFAARVLLLTTANGLTAGLLVLTRLDFCYARRSRKGA